MAIKSLRDLLVGPGPISQFEHFGHRQEAPVTSGLSTAGFAPSANEAATTPTNVFGNGTTGMAPEAVTATGAPLGTFNFGNPFDNEGGRDSGDDESGSVSADESGGDFGGDDDSDEGEDDSGEGDDDSGGEGDDDDF